MTQQTFENIWDIIMSYPRLAKSPTYKGMPLVGDLDTTDEGWQLSKKTAWVADNMFTSFVREKPDVSLQDIWGLGLSATIHCSYGFGNEYGKKIADWEKTDFTNDAARYLTLSDLRYMAHFSLEIAKAQCYGIPIEFRFPGGLGIASEESISRIQPTDRTYVNMGSLFPYNEQRPDYAEIYETSTYIQRAWTVTGTTIIEAWNTAKERGDDAALWQFVQDKKPFYTIPLVREASFRTSKLIYVPLYAGVTFAREATSSITCVSEITGDDDFVTLLDGWDSYSYSDDEEYKLHDGTNHWLNATVKLKYVKTLCGIGHTYVWLAMAPNLSEEQVHEQGIPLASFAAASIPNRKPLMTHSFIPLSKGVTYYIYIERKESAIGPTLDKDFSGSLIFSRTPIFGKAPNIPPLR